MIPKRIVYMSTGDYFAIYNAESRRLLTSGKRDRDPVFTLEELGFDVEVLKLQDTDGGPPPLKI